MLPTEPIFFNINVFYMCITLFLAAKILFSMFLSEIFFPFNKLNLDLLVPLVYIFPQPY